MGHVETDNDCKIANIRDDKSMPKRLHNNYDKLEQQCKELYEGYNAIHQKYCILNDKYKEHTILDQCLRDITVREVCCVWNIQHIKWWEE